MQSPVIGVRAVKTAKLTRLAYPHAWVFLYLFHHLLHSVTVEISAERKIDILIEQHGEMIRTVTELRRDFRYGNIFIVIIFDIF